jgi:hypothetical protein
MDLSASASLKTQLHKIMSTKLYFFKVPATIRQITEGFSAGTKRVRACTTLQSQQQHQQRLQQQRQQRRRKESRRRNPSTELVATAGVNVVVLFRRRRRLGKIS